MGKIIDLTGEKFGRWTVLEFDCIRNRKYYWKCICECGTIKSCEAHSLRSERTRSCGCALKTNLLGNKFGYLTVTAKSDRRKGAQHWQCVCDCGVSKTVAASALISGDTISCGCYKKQLHTIHGHSANKKTTKTLNSWTKMLQRCNNHNHISYKNYGGRGITVCERWANFENFLADMGERPEGCTLDRINLDGNYSPDNCRWSTKSIQNYNRRTSARNKLNTRGVCLSSDGYYIAQISKDSRHMHLGAYKTIDEAIRARTDAELIYYGFHPGESG